VEIRSLSRAPDFIGAGADPNLDINAGTYHYKEIAREVLLPFTIGFPLFLCSAQSHLAA
jgi:hypothetical protein